MAGSKSKSKLGQFYRSLIAKGKKPIVALMALMRKIIVIANAKFIKKESVVNKLKLHTHYVGSWLVNFLGMKLAIVVVIYKI